MFFLRRWLSHAASRLRADAIFLGSERIYDLPAKQFKLWMAGSCEPLACEVEESSEIGSGCDQMGNPISFFDGEPFVSDSHKEMLSVAENQVDLVIRTWSKETPIPGFLSTTPNFAPVSSKIFVDVLFGTVDQLPDFQANIAYLRWFEKSLQNPKSLPLPNPVCTELVEQAKNRQPESGLWLPVEAYFEHNTVTGVLRLDNSLGKARFLATLFLSDGLFPLKEGVVLSRRVLWHEEQNKKEAFLDVARIERPPF